MCVCVRETYPPTFSLFFKPKPFLLLLFLLLRSLSLSNLAVRFSLSPSISLSFSIHMPQCSRELIKVNTLSFLRLSLTGTFSTRSAISIFRIHRFCGLQFCLNFFFFLQFGTDFAPPENGGVVANYAGTGTVI